MFDKIIQTMGVAIERSLDNNNALAYWLSHTTTLLYLLQKTLRTSSTTVCFWFHSSRPGAPTLVVTACSLPSPCGDALRSSEGNTSLACLRDYSYSYARAAPCSCKLVAHGCLLCQNDPVLPRGVAHLWHSPGDARVFSEHTSLDVLAERYIMSNPSLTRLRPRLRRSPCTQPGPPSSRRPFPARRPLLRCWSTRPPRRLSRRAPR